MGFSVLGPEGVQVSPFVDNWLFARSPVILLALCLEIAMNLLGCSVV